MRRARLLCNLISFKCKKGVIPTYRGILITYKGGRTSTRGELQFKVWHDNDLELNANEINNIENDPNHSLYQHFSRSFIALLLYDDHATLIKELYQILEDDDTFPEGLIKYLRHAVSHGDPLTLKTIRHIKEGFGPNYFVFKDQRFDYDSPINIRNLRIEAWKFMDEMLKIYKNNKN
jgi:hypothetical protein